MPEPRKTPAQIAAGTEATQGWLSIAGAVCFAIAGALAGYALADWLEITPLLAVAGFFAPLGSLAIFFATRKPPEILPPERPADG